jgi:hypothetical protein
MFIAIGATMMDLARAQTQTPISAEQCRKDVRAWTETMDLHGDSPVPYKQLVARQVEMIQCEGSDSDADFKSIYELHIRAAETEIRWRLDHFVSRHGLMREFLVEDEQGKR